MTYEEELIAFQFSSDDSVIGVDFDGTLVEYDGYKGDFEFGKPIQSMIDECSKAIGNGYKIVVFSARCDCDEVNNAIIEHLSKAGLDVHGATNIKLKIFKEFWDDRAMRVRKNKGVFSSTNGTFTHMTEEDICLAFGLTPKSLQVARLMSLPCFNNQVGGSHYKDMLIEPAVYCEANKIPHLEAGVIKYVSRHRAKNGKQDIDKASHILTIVDQTTYGVEK